VLTVPLNNAGALLPEPPGTVLHTYWDATGIKDTKGNVWTSVGSVPIAASGRSPFANGRYGAGPFNGTVTGNYYTLGTGNDAMDQANFYACAVINPSALDVTTTSILVHDGVSQGSNGWQLVTNESGNINFWTSTGGAGEANTLIAGAPNTVCWGASTQFGGRCFIKVNERAAVINSGCVVTPDTGGANGVARMGLHWDYQYPFTGRAFEILFVAADPGGTAPEFEAFVTPIVDFAFGHTASTGKVTVTRADPLTYSAGSRNATAGPLFAERAGTVSHVYWNGSALVDTVGGNSWSMTGTVPQVTEPTQAPPSAGPYGAAQYYDGGTSLMEFGGDWSVTMMLKSTTTGTQVVMGKQNTAQTNGWSCYLGNPNSQCQIHDGAIRTTTTGGALLANTPTVVTFGKSGGNCYIKLNLNATGTIACGTMTAASSDGVRLGRTGLNALYATATTIYEVIGATEAYSDTLHFQRYYEMTSNTFQAPIWTAPPNALAIESTGAGIWKGSTNYVLNDRTHPKAAEATASLGTGAYVGWHAGTGTMTIAAGTATVTGLSCTAVSPGTLCTFTVTGAGTMNITTSASTVTMAQIEPGTYSTEEIATAGASASRAATVASTVESVPLGNKWCHSATVTAGNGRAWTVVDAYLWGMGASAAANTARLRATSGGTLVFDVYDSGATIKTWTTGAHSWTAGSTHRVTACNNAGAMSVYSDGVVLSGSTSGAGTGILSATATPLYIGQISTGSYLDGYTAQHKTCRGATKYGDCR
jgi:hypothetical protein